MIKFILLFLLFVTSVVIPQGKNEALNSTIFYVFITDVTFSKPSYHLLVDPAKIKAGKIKKREVIRSMEYLSDPSFPDVKGIESIDSREIVEYDKNGNPVKFSLYSYSWDGSLMDYSIKYDKDGSISEILVTSSDTTKKVINYTGKYQFRVIAGKITTINYDVDPQYKGMGLPNSYNFSYRSDGSLEKITAGVDAHNFITCDEKGRISTMVIGAQKYMYHYEKNGSISRESVVDEYGEKWEMIYNYDAIGNLLSVKTNEDAFLFMEMSYTFGKEGFPAKAKLLFDTKSSRQGINYEFNYTKF